MACNPNRIELSNAAATTVQITLATDPGDGTTVTLQVDELGVNGSNVTKSGIATFVISAVSAANNSIWDATIQVGANRPATAEVLVTETNTAQTVGITVSDSSVTYCAPTGGGGGAGTGDALTTSAISQFVDVTYPDTFRDSDVLTRSISGQWTAQRPEQLWVDRRPMLFDAYGSDNDSANWGVSTQSHRLTPVTGTVTHDATNNGRIEYFTSRVVTPQSTLTSKIERYLFGTPSGHIQDQGATGYASTAGSVIRASPASIWSFNSDGTQNTEFDSPFTTTGLTSGALGNQEEAWTEALSWLRAQTGFDKALIGAYIGYWIPYDPSNPSAYFDRTAINGNNVSYSWIKKPTPEAVRDFFQTEFDILNDIGFEYLGYDNSTRVWFDNENETYEGRQLIDAFEDVGGIQTFYEAVPRDLTTFDQYADPRPYQNGKYFLLFPTLSEIDGTTLTPTPSASRVVVDNWKLDPSNSEVHLVFEWRRLAGDSATPGWLGLTGARIRELMNIAHERGFVVSVGSCSFPTATSDGWTVGEFIQYAIDLGKQSSKSLTGSDIDRSVDSSTSIASSLSTLDASVLALTSTIIGLDLDALVDVNAPSPSDGEVLTWDTATAKWIPTGVSGTGTVTSVGLNVPGGFTVVGTNPITSSGTFEITSALSGVIKADGAATFSGSAELNDLADVNVAQGAGNNGDLVYYDHAAGAGAKFKGAARSSIALSEFNDDLDYAASSHTHAASDITSGTLDAARLPAISDSYLMLIEAPSDKDYTLDARVAAGRTVTNFYAKTSAGTCTATLKNLSDSPPSTIGTINVTNTGGSAPSLNNATLDENERLGITISSTSSAEDLELVVEYTQ